MPEHGQLPRQRKPASVRELNYTERCEHPMWHNDEPLYNPVEHEAWRNMMRRTHAQRRCPHCHLWVMWEPTS